MQLKNIFPVIFICAVACGAQSAKPGDDKITAIEYRVEAGMTGYSFTLKITADSILAAKNIIITKYHSRSLHSATHHYWDSVIHLINIEEVRTIKDPKLSLPDDGPAKTIIIYTTSENYTFNNWTFDPAEYKSIRALIHLLESEEEKLK